MLLFEKAQIAKLVYSILALNRLPFHGYIRSMQIKSAVQKGAVSIPCSFQPLPLNKNVGAASWKRLYDQYVHSEKMR